MKNLFKIALVSAGVLSFGQGHAQTHESVGHKIGGAAKDVGHKTSEVASKGKSRVIDKRYKDKWGPRGETVFIDSHSKYYFVDKRGHHVFLTKSELRDKPYKH